MEPSISIVIHTHNEQKNIHECIESAKLLSNTIILVDMESTDKTVEIAKQNGAQIYSFPYSTYVEPSREFGINQVKTNWVLILDADERITSELVLEIKEKIKITKNSYFSIPRKNIFARKQWLKNGWWPDYQIRLINKKYFKGWPREIHSTPLIAGKMGRLDNPLIHYFHGDFEKMIDKTIIFENIEADLLFKAGRPASTMTFFRKFLGELFRRLVRDKGFLDGKIGIIESIYQAFSKTTTYLFLYEKKIISSL